MTSATPRTTTATSISRRSTSCAQRRHRPADHAQRAKLRFDSKLSDSSRLVRALLQPRDARQRSTTVVRISGARPTSSTVSSADDADQATPRRCSAPCSGGPSAASGDLGGPALRPAEAHRDRHAARSWPGALELDDVAPAPYAEPESTISRQPLPSHRHQWSGPVTS